MPVVRIIATQPVHYSLNNGLTLSQYEPNELYEIPRFAAEGMVRRGWARIVSKEELDEIIELPSYKNGGEKTEANHG